MVVKLTSGGQLLFPLTSPPPKPTPAPDPKLVAKIVSYPDRDIIVTVPFPDSIELVAGVTNDIHVEPDISGKSVKVIYNELDAEIQKSLVEIATSLPPFVSGGVNTAKTLAEFFIVYDAVQPLNRARLLLWRSQNDDFGSWSIRFEFSASKAGPLGLVKLTAGLEAVLPFLNVSKLVQAFRVARIDAAIDCIGATPLDVIAHVPKPGKRMVFVGPHGRPESVYFYEMKKPLKLPPKKLSVSTRGPLRLRLTLYERRDYHLQLLLEPPYGPSPVTRAEVSKRWTKERPFLSTLADMDNLLAGRRVAYAAAANPGHKREWRRFCLATLGSGANGSLFSWLPGPGSKFAKIYAECEGDLIDPSCWTRWGDGLKVTGLMDWIKVAQADH